MNKSTKRELTEEEKLERYKDSAAFASITVDPSGIVHGKYGCTKLELAAMMAMQGLLAGNADIGTDIRTSDRNMEQITDAAVLCAEKLLRKLYES